MILRKKLLQALSILGMCSVIIVGGFSVKLILEKMYISGEMKLEKRFGKIRMYMPN